MATITSCTVVLVSIYPVVVVVHIVLVVVLVAVNATELRKIAGCGMAFHTGIPLAFMIATVNREIHPVVVPSRRCPSIFIVAVLASRGEASLLVVGIVGSVVVCCVAAEASVWRIIIIAVMALNALVCN